MSITSEEHWFSIISNDEMIIPYRNISYVCIKDDFIELTIGQVIVKINNTADVKRIVMNALSNFYKRGYN